MGKKVKYTISLYPETKAAIIEYVEKKHISGGLSGGIEHLAYKVIYEPQENKETTKNNM